MPSAKIPPPPSELLQAVECFTPAYCAPAEIAELTPLLLPTLAERRAAVEVEAQTIRAILGAGLYKYPPVIDGRHSVELSLWHYRPPELADEIAYFYMYKEAEVGRDPWRVINATDHEKSDWYGIALCGDRKFTQRYAKTEIYVSEKAYRMLKATCKN